MPTPISVDLGKPFNKNPEKWLGSPGAKPSSGARHLRVLMSSGLFRLLGVWG